MHLVGTFEGLSTRLHGMENFKILLRTFVTGHQVVKYLPKPRIKLRNVNTELQFLNNYAGHFIDNISRFNT